MFEQVLKVLHQLKHTPLSQLCSSRRDVGDADKSIDAVRPVPESSAIFSADAEELCDDACRQWIGEIIHHVHRAGLCDPIKQVLRILMYRLSQSFYNLRNKGFMRQRSYSSVIRRIHVDEP